MIEYEVAELVDGIYIYMYFDDTTMKSGVLLALSCR